MKPDRRKVVIAVILVAAVIAWSIYASGSPDREVAGLIGTNPLALSDSQIATELMRRIPPGTSQQTAVDYLLKHGLDRRQILTLYPEPAGRYLMILIRNRGYVPNPIIQSNEYTIFIFVSQDKNVARITVNRRWDRLGYASGA